MVNYQKLYAFLVGQIDNTLQQIAGKLFNGETGRDDLIAVSQTLKDTLLTAEEIYLNETEEE